MRLRRVIGFWFLVGLHLSLECKPIKNQLLKTRRRRKTFVLERQLQTSQKFHPNHHSREHNIPMNRRAFLATTSIFTLAFFGQSRAAESLKFTDLYSKITVRGVEFSPRL